MHWTAKLALVFIYYLLTGAFIIMIDVLVFYDEYVDNLKEMLDRLDRDMRDTVDNSEFAAIEICLRMFINEVVIWPLILIARTLDLILHKGD